MSPSTWADVETAFIGLVLLVIGIASVAVGRVLPALIAAWTAKLVEDATTARVKRVDEALDAALAGGASPMEAAESAAKKLPQTLERSGKDVADLVGEAIVRQDAKNDAKTKAGR
jgi:hypothetical protein